MSEGSLGGDKMFYTLFELDGGVGYMSAYICQTYSHCSLMICALHRMNFASILLQLKMESN